MGIERFDRGTMPDTVVRTLEREGVAIVEGVLSPERVDRIRGELQPMFDRVPISGDAWTGRRAQVVHTTVKHSAAYREMLLDPFFLGTVDGVLGQNCHTWRLSASSVMTVHGGGGLQPLHRDEDLYEHFVDRSPEAAPYILGFMLALTDFTVANGATSCPAATGGRGTGSPTRRRWSRPRCRAVPSRSGSARRSMASG
ncbi:MAG: phytanoyl-CoA dioxygenase family protein [Gammaproteobacteria bacterium]|nr:phytanoyl-CoA dioxygenase family protein [Gammaproteobacteria bacterium]